MNFSIEQNTVVTLKQFNLYVLNYALRMLHMHAKLHLPVKSITVTMLLYLNRPFSHFCFKFHEKIDTLIFFVLSFATK